MPYLIDGHNLIAHMSGISLDDPDDEARLLLVLRSFCARTGKKVFVYFDRRSPGSQNPGPRGGLTARFVRAPRTADDAIRAHIRRLGRDAANWTVVSSDHEIQHTAKSAGARTISSLDFAESIHHKETQEEIQKPPPPGTQDEIEKWERLFRVRGSEENA